MRRLLYVVGQLGTGGHVRTAITYALALRHRGWAIEFCGTDSGGAQLVSEAGFRFLPVREVVPGEFFPGIQDEELAASLSPYAVHSFDLGSLPFAARIARRAGAGVVHSICGGKVPWYPVPSWRGLVVLSDELADGLEQRAGRRPPVVRGRIDFSQRTATASRTELRQRLGVGEHQSVLLMIARVGTTKMGSIRTFTEVVATLARTDPGRSWRGVLCGAVDDPRIGAHVHRLLGEANERLGRCVLQHDDSFSRHAYQLLPIADVFVGVGDALAEAVHNGIPALVLGERGFAGMLEPGTERELYRYNLSGRNVSEAEPIAETAERIRALAEDETARQRAVRFGRESVTRHLSAEGAVDYYEKAYEEARIASGPSGLKLSALRALLRVRRWYLTRVPHRVRMAVLRARRAA